MTKPTNNAPARIAIMVAALRCGGFWAKDGETPPSGHIDAMRNGLAANVLALPARYLLVLFRVSALLMLLVNDNDLRTLADGIGDDNYTAARTPNTPARGEELDGL